MDRLEDDNEKVKRRLEQAFEDMNRRDGDLNMLQRRLNELEGELDKERKSGEKLRQDNDTLCQVCPFNPSN